MALALLVTVLVEGLAGWVYALLRRLPVSGVIPVLPIASLLTLPALWLFVGTLGNKHYWEVLLAGEAVVWLVEAGVLFCVLRKRIRWWDALLLAFIANAASFLVGLVVPV